MLGLLGLVALVQAFGFGLTKAYAIDEFFYVHQAWTMLHEGMTLGIVAQGERFLPLWLFSPLIALSGDNPAHMLWLRGEMALFWLVTLANIAVICAQLYKRWRPQGESPDALVYVAAAAGVACAMGVQPLFWSALEMRPDSVAILCVTGSLALLWGLQGGRYSRQGAALAGVVLFLGVCSSVKVLVYGAAFLPVALLALWPRHRRAFPHPVIFCLAFGTMGALTALVIAWQGTFAEFWHGLYGMAKHHEAHYPALDPWRLIRPLVRQNPHVVGLAALGLVELVRRLCAGLYREQRVGGELLILLLCAGGWASFFLQKGAYEYSLIPGIAMTCVVASVGVSTGVKVCLRLGRAKWLGLGLALVGLGVLGASAANVWHRTKGYPRVDEQLQVHRDIHRLTAPEDVAYDMSATFVYRPRAHHFAFLDNLRKHLHWHDLLREVPRSIEARETVMFVLEARYWSFHPTSLGHYLQKNFIRYDDDLRFWGRRYDGNQQAWQRDFKAIRTDHYFVYPPDWQAHGELTIDGQPVRSQIVELKKGEHQVSWVPKAATPFLAPLYLVWLPRDGQPFMPDRSPKPFMLGRHILPGGIPPDHGTP